MNITRRTAVAATMTAIGAAALGGCAGKSDVEKIAEANASIIEALDLGQTRLPLGSVVETALGRFMVAGHKCIVRTLLADGTVSKKAYDYYGVAWPLGIDSPGNEGLAAAVLNVADIEAVLFVGLVNAEDKDMRDYVASYDVAGGSADVVTDAPMAWVAYSEVKSLEQQLRMQGALSADLYGTGFDGGLLYSPEG